MTTTTAIWDRVRHEYWLRLPAWLRLRMPLRFAAETRPDAVAIAMGGEGSDQSGGTVWDQARHDFWRRQDEAGRLALPSRLVAPDADEAETIVASGGAMPANNAPHDAVARWLPKPPAGPTTLVGYSEFEPGTDPRWPTGLTEATPRGIVSMVVQATTSTESLYVGQKAAGSNDPVNIVMTEVPNGNEAIVTENLPTWLRFAAAKSRITLVKTVEV